jgi:2-dehydropantoate 2-reductase
VAEVAVVGVGAIGGVVASELIGAGRHGVRLCVRTPFHELVREYDGRTDRHPVSPLTDPTGQAPVDWVLLATKAHQTDAAAGWLKALRAPHTRVAVLQNGVEHLDRLRGHVPDEAVVPVVVNCPVTAVEPGHVVQRAAALLTVPDDPGGRDLAELFDGTGVQVAVTDDWLTTAWTKLCSNAVGGALTALTGRTTEVFADDAVAELGRRLGAEVVAVGRACGAQLPADLPDQVVASLRSAPGSTNSILHDRLQGRPLEFEARNAVVVRKGAVHGIPTPYSETVVALLGALPDARPTRLPATPGPEPAPAGPERSQA